MDPSNRPVDGRIQMKLFVAGLSFRSAPVAVREKLAVAAKVNACRCCRLKMGAELDEVVLVSTCNRVEIYGSAQKVNGNIHGIFRHLAADTDVAPYLYVKEGEVAAQHLFSVASGLDSMVIGETEITGQIKNAYQIAKDAGLTGRATNRWFQTALQVAKEVRTHTNIGRGAVSVGSVAVELMEKIYEGGLEDKTVMIIGAGKMGEACVRHLAKKGARSVLVSNRSFERAQGLAAEFGGRAVSFDDRHAAIIEADIVVSSTGCPQTILKRAELAPIMPARRNRPLFLVDIAVPRDIDPDVEQLDNVYLYNIDHLEAIVRENLRSRQQELGRCHEIITERACEVMTRFAGRPVQARKPSAAAQPAFNLFQPAVCTS